MSGTGRFSCFLIGSDSLLVECAEILLERGHEVRGVVTDTARLASWAREQGLGVHGFSSDWRGVMAARPFDWLFSITYLSVIPAEVLRLPRRGAINFHDGPLPRYAGLNTPAWGIINGEREWGITYHLMTPDVDRGDVLARRDFPIGPRDTSLTLNAHCFEAAMEAFGDLVDGLASGAARPIPQERGHERFFRRHQRPDAACVLDWSRPASVLDAMIRGLDFGRYTNPLGSAKIFLGDEAFIVTSAEMRASAPGAEPGRVLAVSNGTIDVAAGQDALSIRGLARLSGHPVEVREAAARWRLAPGARLGRLSPDAVRRLTELGPALSRAERFWIHRLLDLRPLEIDGVSAGDAEAGAPQRAAVTPDIPARFRDRFVPRRGGLDEALVAAAAVYLSLRAGADTFDVPYGDAESTRGIDGCGAFLYTRPPLRVEFDSGAGFDEAIGAVNRAITVARERGAFLRDVIARTPELHNGAEHRLAALDAVGLERTDDPGAACPRSALTLAVGRGALHVVHDPTRVRPETAHAIAAQLTALLTGLAENPALPLSRRDLLPPEERRRVLSEWNATARPVESACIHELIRRQAARTPDAPALACGPDQVTYPELDTRANRLAHFLRSLGVGSDVRVGVCVERSIDMVVAVLGVLKAGGAYVPIDPAYPPQRTRFVIEDADMPVLITQEHLAGELPETRARIVRIDADWAEIEKHADADPAPEARPENLAYVIYTSGSTGKPKGVMVEHRNAVNFFAGMDDRLPGPPEGQQGVWLAVTSLSFDISVLELLWTLARGYKVVIHTDVHRRPPRAGAPQTGMQFSLFYFAADEGERGADKYRLLLEGAKFADRNGFVAVWTPERHFHAFGGLYPNPAVAGAALSSITEHVQIRAGSVVLPLHHPARIAEEWALVDNLSGGRVGVSFASGWQPVDFVLRPENYPQRQKLMYDGIETVRKLWRGEAVTFPDAAGKPTEIRTLPRPVQKDLPVWVTTAGNIDTWKSAAQIGANILTHLLGQTVEEITEKVRIYREVYREHHPGKPPGIVTIMLHTFVGEDDDQVRETVRRPMIQYLGTSLSLVKNVASSWAAFKKGAGAGAAEIDLKTLSQAEMDGLLEFSFERYFQTSGLFGTVETCMKLVERLETAGVDEIACLVDFGVESGTALAHLEHLNRLRGRVAKRRVTGDESPVTSEQSPVIARDDSIGGLIRKHGVTHFQCTPSMARMILMDDSDRAALSMLSVMLVGGEAFPGALARDLAAATPARLINMYGPTETTVWSSTHPVAAGSATIPIGRPIANTELYVLDLARRPVPVGVTGELYIGGAGVVRGYLNRPELTAERFVPDPFSARPDARMYRTGDLARWLPDGGGGAMDFLGRADFQVKVRGHRIELGEIESAIGALPGVRAAAVTLREDTPGDQRLVAYVVRDRSRSVGSDEIKTALRRSLPDYMLPSHVSFLEALPLTPNKKVDRKALPKPEQQKSPPRRVNAGADQQTPDSRVQGASAASAVEESIQAIWREVLGVSDVGLNDNFFDLGGHSLLAVKAHRRLKEILRGDLAITDLFRFPTVRALAAHVQSSGSEAPGADDARQRGEARRELLARRRGVRAAPGEGEPRS